VYTLTDPASISLYDVATVPSEILGKQVSYVNISLEKAREIMLNRGFPECKTDALYEYAKAPSEGYSGFTTEEVEQLTGHPATSYKTFANGFAQVFRTAELRSILSHTTFGEHLFHPLG